MLVAAFRKGATQTPKAKQAHVCFNIKTMQINRHMLLSHAQHLRACALKPSSGHFSDPYSGAPLSTKLLQALQAGCWLGGSNAQPQKHQRPATFLSSMAPSGSIRPA